MKLKNGIFLIYAGLLGLLLSTSAQADSPTLTLVTPNGGGILYSSTTVNIQWTLALPQTSTLTYKTILSLRHGIQPIPMPPFEEVQITANAISKKGVNNYSWTIPPGLNATDWRMHVEIKSGFNTLAADDSDAPFQIDGNTSPADEAVAVVWPNRGEVLTGGNPSYYPLQWTYNGHFAQNSTSLSIVDSAGKEILRVKDNVTTSPGVNTFYWNMPHGLTGSYRLKVRLNNWVDISDGNNVFQDSVSLPTLTVLTPNSSDTLYSSSTITIQWTLALPQASTFTYQTILSLRRGAYPMPTPPDELQITLNAVSKTGVNNYAWTIPPGLNGSDWRMHVEIKSGFNTFAADDSDASFQIYGNNAPPDEAVSVVWPNRGEILTGGNPSYYPLQWTYNGPFPQNSTSLSIVDSAGKEILRVKDNVTTSPGVNAFYWNIPHGVTGTNLRLKVRLNNLVDMSDANNTIRDSVTAPTLTVLTPNSADTLYSSSTINVQWALALPQASTITYKTILSLRRGGYPMPMPPDELQITLNAASKTGVNNYSWTIPPGLNGSDWRMHVEIKSGFNTFAADDSDASFQIYGNNAPPDEAVAVVWPNRGEVLTGGNPSYYPLQWTYNGPFPQNSTSLAIVDSTGKEILRVKDNVTTSPGANAFYWNMPHGITGSNLRLRVRLNNLVDDSDGNNVFQDNVSIPTLTLVAPNGGGVLYSSSTVIEWTLALPQTSTVTYPTTLVLRRGTHPIPSPSDELRITVNTPSRTGVNRYAWNVPPGLNGTDWRVHVEINSGFNLFAADDSDSPFEIYSSLPMPPQVAVMATWPNRAEILKASDSPSYPLQWTYSGLNPTEATLSVVNSAGMEVSRITNAAPTSPGINTFNWQIPNGLSGTNLRLRIRLNTDGFLTDDSDANNTIIGNPLPQLPGKAFLASMALGTARNDFTGWLGMQIKTGAQALEVTSVGRVYLSSNTQSHTIRFVQANTGQDVPGGSATWIPMGTTNKITYVSLASTITLAPNTLYYLLSSEQSGGDSWYHWNTVLTPTTDGTIPGAISEKTTQVFVPAGGTNRGYVPLDFRYMTTNLQPAVEIAPNAQALTNTTSSVRVHPNPFRTSSGVNAVTFDQLPAASTVKLFTISGRWMKTLSAPSGSVEWDLTNDSGDRVASGLYLYLVTDDQNNQTRGKLAVIR